MIRHALIPVYLVLCVLLGGATAAGFLANLFLQFMAIALMVLTFAVAPAGPPSHAARQVSGMIFLVGALIVIQLVPLPPGVWGSLPGREEIVQGYEALGQPLPWMPLTLSPAATLASVFGLLPALAVYFGVTRLGAFRASWLAISVVGVTTLAVMVGALQVGGGLRSPAYLYEVTNRGFAVGFFSNANHMATLLLMAIPFITAILATLLRNKKSARRSSGPMVIAGVALVVVLVGLALNRSLAGWGLAVPVTAASLLILWRRSIPKWTPLLIALIGIGAVGVVLTGPLGNNLTSAEARTSDESRFTSFSLTFAEAREHLPFGAGIGTFVDLYRTRENPAEVTRRFMNHAHNDYLELLLETGVPGVALFILFLSWWVHRTWVIWRDPEPQPFALAATIASAAVVAHSIVDYPLRTAAISALFAAAIALMVDPRARAGRSERSGSSSRHLSAE